MLGNKIFVLNSEKAIISGNKAATIEKYKKRRDIGGTALKGPYHSKDTEKILKRAIRGMLPDYSRRKGKEAWKRIKCFNDIPKEYEKEKLIKLKIKPTAKHIALKELKAKL